MIRFLLIFLCISSTAVARPLLDLEEVYMTGAKMGAPSRDPMAPQYTGEWENRAALGFRFNLLGAMYWDNYVHMEATTVPKTVGWHWVLGVRLHPAVDIFHEHHSRHLLDEKSPTNYIYENPNRTNFPVEDSYGLRFNIYTGTKGKAIWD